MGVATRFSITFVVYIRIYLTVRRHNSPIQYICKYKITREYEDTTSCPSQDLNPGRPTQIPEHWSLDYSRLTIARPYPVLLSFLSPFFYMHCSYRNPGLIVALEKKNYLSSYLNSIIYCWKMRHSTRCHGHTQEHVTAWGRNEPSRLIYNRSSNVVHLDKWSLLCDWQRLCAVLAWQSK